MKTFALTLLLALSLPVLAKVGEVVPQDILPKTWIVGTAPQTWPTDQIYLFECWASWCKPCLSAIPHMEEMWQQVKGEGFRFVGVNVGDRKTPEELKEFLSRQPVPPTYAMSIDEGNRFANAMGVRGIPQAYAVCNGKVIWQGHPASLTVEKVRSWKTTAVAPAVAPEATRPAAPENAPKANRGMRRWLKRN